MAAGHQFEHLPLILSHRGDANLHGRGTTSPQTVANKKIRVQHSGMLGGSADKLSVRWKSEDTARLAKKLPVLPAGKPILVKVDPGFELDELRRIFEFEIVAEQEEGFVLVAAEDIDMAAFTKMVGEFADEVHGSAKIAEVHKLYDEPGQMDRIKLVLSERLFEDWGNIDDAQDYVVDIGVACIGTIQIPTVLNPRKTETAEQWETRSREWELQRKEAYEEWEDLCAERQGELMDWVHGYENAMVMSIEHEDTGFVVLPDSFTFRLKIQGIGLKDLVLNYPFVFEVVEPEDIALPQYADEGGARPLNAPSPLPPDSDAPAVCVIDSGIQEGHVLLEPAIDKAASICFLPNKNATDIGDFVRPGGHGTRVAGAVLYGENVPESGTPQLPFWIQNSRVLDDNNKMPEELYPPMAMHASVDHFHSELGTRIFNHSINANGSFRTKHMSAWAAEIDQLCFQHDIMIIQSTGNLPTSGNAPLIGVAEHLAANREYPDYLLENSCRISNPAQSLQAITVGSIAYGDFESNGWRTFAEEFGQPSAFTRSGFGIWGVIKPEVVEFGGDAVLNSSVPPSILLGSRVQGACPNLIRSTMYPPGPASARDDAGTSYSAPKVAGIAAAIQRVLPDEPSLLYRALIIQSARWPAWAEAKLVEIRGLHSTRNRARREELKNQASNIIRWIGFGLPDESRATTNTDYRTTLITSGTSKIKAGECHVYQIPIPSKMRGPAEDFDIRIDVTLSFVAQPRRTRRKLSRYLSTWVDWKSSKLGESIDTLVGRAIKDYEADEGGDKAKGNALPWVLHQDDRHGFIRGVRRNKGTVQKDWAVVKSNALPEHFCIAVAGHKGWNQDPDATARYCLAVTLEIQGQEIAIYDPLRVAVEELAVEVDGVEVEAVVEVEG